jgi:hypothetical protein
MTTLVSRSLPLAVLLLVVTACASAPRDTAGEPADTGTATTIEVENQSFYNMTVFVFEGGRRVRLGTVPGLATRTFPIPERLLFGITSLRFQLDPLGGDRTPLTQEIAVTRGDALRMIIPPR